MRKEGKKLYLTRHEHDTLMQQGPQSGIAYDGEEIIVTDDPKEHAKPGPVSQTPERPAPLPPTPGYSPPVQPNPAQQTQDPVKHPANPNEPPWRRS
jgi:hypothetical protein